MLMNHKQCNYRQVFDTIAVKIKATKRDRVDAMWQEQLKREKEKTGYDSHSIGNVTAP